jgi:hypothetical protein
MKIIIKSETFTDSMSVRKIMLWARSPERFLLDGERWENDWAAEGYIPNKYSGENSVGSIESD